MAIPLRESLYPCLGSLTASRGPVMGRHWRHLKPDPPAGNNWVSVALVQAVKLWLEA